MDKKIILAEANFKAVRSSGAGGQNVNKVSSKVVLTFDVLNSKGFSEEEKDRIQSKLATKISQDGLLIVTCDEDRSQLKNKEIVKKRFFLLLENALKIPKPRKPTITPWFVKEKRLNSKKVMSALKKNRRKPNL